MTKLCLVAALANDGVLGKNGDLPWKNLPTDMAHFRELTRHSVVLMGRKTWDSLRIQPLPRRVNIVVSSTFREDIWAVGGLSFTTLQEALDEAHWIADDTDSKTVYVIGGGQIYKSLIAYADEMYLTHVHSTLEGDTFFPDFEDAEWDVEELPIKWNEWCDDYPFTIKHYKKIR
jgi:dihydrofolate reductase